MVTLDKAWKIACWEEIAFHQAEILAIAFKHSLTCQNHTEQITAIQDQYKTTKEYLVTLKKQN